MFKGSSKLGPGDLAHLRELGAEENAFDDDYAYCKC